jgi:hypothetical protein
VFLAGRTKVEGKHNIKKKYWFQEVSYFKVHGNRCGRIWNSLEELKNKTVIL